MKKLLLIPALLIIFYSCNSKARQSDSPYRGLCETFLSNLYDKKYDKVISSMDDLFISAAKNINLDSALNIISDNFRKDYGGKIKSTFISSELTINENLPSTFLIFKVESFDRFGYYFFYINDKTKKILVFSESGGIKPKRK
jgi:hypothetical protein